MGTNWNKIADEFKAKLKEGKISSCTIPELMKYIEALSNINSGQESDRIQRACYLQTLNTLYNVKVTKALSTNNTILTCVVIALAICTLVLSYLQLKSCL